MTSRRNGRKPDRGIDASIWGLSDTELLAVVDDLADEDGWTSTLDVRVQLGENPERVGHRSGIGPRLGWMARYGWLERHSDTSGVWRLSAMGHAILDDGELSRSMTNALAKLTPAQRVRLTRAVGQSGAESAPEVKAALRREWQRTLLRR